MTYSYYAGKQLARIPSESPSYVQADTHITGRGRQKSLRRSLAVFHTTHTLLFVSERKGA